MSVIVQHGSPHYLFGITSDKPETRKILNIPEDAKVKIRVRSGKFVIAFVKSGDTIKRGYLQPTDDGLLFHPRGMNQTRKATNQ